MKKKFPIKCRFDIKKILKVVSMVVHRKDMRNEKLKLKKYVFSERPFLQKNPEDRTNRFTQKRHDKR